MDGYPAAVAGETFSNADGSDRQGEIRRCSIGEPVTLEREPDNPYDEMCVKVISARGVQIGNIARAAGWVAERMDEGGQVSATIYKLNPGPRGTGVVLMIRL